MAEPLPFSQVLEQERAQLGVNTEKPLTALCLSGGGIRSATFALGVLQALARKGLLGEFDYFSTVSGGGFIGGWLTAWCRNAEGGINEVIEKLKQTPLAPPIMNLRRFSNYLSPRLGLLSADTWTLVATFLRNLFLNWLILIPMLMAAILLPRVLVSLLHLHLPTEWNKWVIYGELALGLILGVFTVSCIPLWLPSLRAKSSGLSGEKTFVIRHILLIALAIYLVSVSWFQLSAFTPTLVTFMLFGTGVNALGWGVGLWLSKERHPWNRWLIIITFSAIIGALAGGLFWMAVQNAWLAALMKDPLLYTTLVVPLLIVLLLIIAFLFVGLGSWREMIEDPDREWWARSAGWLLIIIVIWLVAHTTVLYGPYLLIGIPAGISSWLASLGGTLCGAMAALIGRSARTPLRMNRLSKKSVNLLAKISIQLAEKLLAPLFALTVISGLSWLITRWLLGRPLTSAAEHTTMLLETPCGVLFMAAVVLFGVGYALGRVFSVNRFSLNALYRNRLIRAYLGASRPISSRSPDPLTGFDPADNILMDEIKQKPIRRPLHLLNLALNVTNGEELAWQQRRARSFTVSCCHAGYGNTYQPSKDYTDAGGISLGAAVSISGAAASPNMGYHSSKVLTFLMAIFNFRLGAWLANPSLCDTKILTKGGPDSPLILLSEMLGRTSDKYKWVYLSDGGHFENLGLYEMVRRHCKLIVVSDASADPHYKFEDLSNALQKIRVDLGIPIEFIKEPKLHNRPGEPGKHVAMLRIWYGANEEGRILYIKPAFSGVESIRSLDVAHYAASHREFPHESTSDQFFNETQFESYRRLGEQSIEVISENWIGGGLQEFLGHIEQSEL
ncbi:MAG: patatin-like phospholipase family protein [Acidobacteria bacterium]|nr:patatin-like phospholipase family protein [Acidobacteriota bacterium]